MGTSAGLSKISSLPQCRVFYVSFDIRRNNQILILHIQFNLHRKKKASYSVLTLYINCDLSSIYVFGRNSAQCDALKSTREFDCACRATGQDIRQPPRSPS